MNRLSAEEQRRILLEQGPKALFLAVLADLAARKPDGAERGAKCFALRAPATAFDIAVGARTGRFVVEEVVFSGSEPFTLHSLQMFRGAQHVPFEVGDSGYCFRLSGDGSELTRLRVRVTPGAILRGAAFGWLYE